MILRVDFDHHKIIIQLQAALEIAAFSKSEHIKCIALT